MNWNASNAVIPGTREIETVPFEQPVSYAEACAAQIARRDLIERGEASNALFLLEHTPVITLGRSSKPEHILADRARLETLGIAVEESDRGGDVTYHGPGQLVAYPVLNLRAWRLSIQWYLRTLEDVLIDLLHAYGLDAQRQEGFTGVWVGDTKVAAIGIALHNWVTYHGIALNVCPDMDHWNVIVPCGIGDRPVASLEQLVKPAPSMHQVMRDFEYRFRAAFA